MNASSSSAGPAPKRPCQSVLIDAGHARTSTARPLAAGPRLHREAPQPHEPGGVLVAERVGGVVGGELVVVETGVGPTAARRRSARARDAAGPRRSRTPGSASRTRRAPRAAARTTGRRRRARRSAVSRRAFSRIEVALERDRLEVGVREDAARASPGLVDLAALDADAAVLDHVDAAPPVARRRARRARRRARAASPGRSPSSATGTPCSKRDDDLPRLARRVGDDRRSACTALAAAPTHGSSITPHSIARPHEVLVDRVGLLLGRARSGCPCLAA